MQNEKLTPKKIKVDKKESLLHIEWNDNHNSIMNFNLLRAACPCATCRGGHENMKPEPDSSVFSTNLPKSSMTEIEKIEMVGSYALSITWGDGHAYGIYTWSYLRALCSCGECSASRLVK